MGRELKLGKIIISVFVILVTGFCHGQEENEMNIDWDEYFARKLGRGQTKRITQVAEKYGIDAKNFFSGESIVMRMKTDMLLLESLQNGTTAPYTIVDAISASSKSKRVVKRLIEDFLNEKGLSEKEKLIRKQSLAQEFVHLWTDLRKDPHSKEQESTWAINQNLNEDFSVEELVTAFDYVDRDILLCDALSTLIKMSNQCKESDPIDNKEQYAKRFEKMLTTYKALKADKAVTCYGVSEAQYLKANLEIIPLAKEDNQCGGYFIEEVAIEKLKEMILPEEVRLDVKSSLVLLNDFNRREYKLRHAKHEYEVAVETLMCDERQKDFEAITKAYKSLVKKQKGKAFKTAFEVGDHTSSCHAEISFVPQSLSMLSQTKAEQKQPIVIQKIKTSAK